MGFFYIFSEMRKLLHATTVYVIKLDFFVWLELYLFFPLNILKDLKIILALQFYRPNYTDKKQPRIVSIEYIVYII